MASAGPDVLRMLTLRPGSKLVDGKLATGGSTDAMGLDNER